MTTLENKVYLFINYEPAYYEGEREYTTLRYVATSLEQIKIRFENQRHGVGEYVLVIDQNLVPDYLDVTLGDNMRNDKGVEVHNASEFFKRLFKDEPEVTKNLNSNIKNSL